MVYVYIYIYINIYKNRCVYIYVYKTVVTNILRNFPALVYALWYSGVFGAVQAFAARIEADQYLLGVTGNAFVLRKT